MKFLFLMDPLEQVVAKKDTSFAFIEGAHRQGIQTYFLPEGGISRNSNGFYFHTIEIQPNRNQEFPFEIIEHTTLTDQDVDAIFIRTDPPFDEKYLMQTWLLSLLPKHIAVINEPNGIRTVNEKLWATQFSSVIPNTLISQNKEMIMRFIQENESVIAKPTNSFGGQSIFLLTSIDTNLNAILENLTQNSTVEIILQEYVSAAKKGDKRILLLNGKPLGAVLRVHSKGDHRNNFFAGGKAEESEIQPEDQKIIDLLSPQLIELGLYFVGIDIIGNRLIEVNVTSPTCLQEMNHFKNTHLEDQVIDFAKNLVDQRKNIDRIIKLA